jgi:hypothetical protein
MWLAHLPDVVRHVGNFISEDNVKKKKKHQLGLWTRERVNAGNFEACGVFSLRDFGVHPVRWLGLKQDK